MKQQRQSKRIHVAWPVLCKTELEDVIGKLNAILKRVSYRGSDDVEARRLRLVLAMESVISEGNKALEALEQAYGE